MINGHPTGSVRISVGYMTTFKNIDAIIQLIKNCYCNKERKQFLRKTKEKIRSQDQTEDNFKSNLNTTKREQTAGAQANKKQDCSMPLKAEDEIKLHEICIYPIKSCAPFRVDTNWIVNCRGLKFDREWMIVKSTGVALTQKSDVKLCLIQPIINEAENTLTLNFLDAESVRIPLRRDPNDNKTKSLFCQSKVCGDRIDGIDCGDEVADWLCDVLCTSGLRLIQQNLNDKRTAKMNSTIEQTISLSNQAQFLLINIASVSWLTDKINDWIEMDNCAEKVLQNTIDRFRANLVIESNKPLEETNWKSIKIGDVQLSVTGSCTRCQMICIDQSTGEKTTEPLQTIAREFQGKVRFGIYLCQCDVGSPSDFERIISCKDKITVEK